MGPAGGKDRSSATYGPSDQVNTWRKPQSRTSFSASRCDLDGIVGAGACWSCGAQSLEDVSYIGRVLGDGRRALSASFWRPWDDVAASSSAARHHGTAANNARLLRPASRLVRLPCLHERSHRGCSCWQHARIDRSVRRGCEERGEPACALVRPRSSALRRETPWVKKARLRLSVSYPLRALL